MEQSEPWWEKPVSWLEYDWGLTICDDMRQLSHPGPMFRWKSFQRSFYDIRASKQPNHSTASQKNFNSKTFRIIHPFHPYKGTEFEIDQVRNVAVERRVFFFNQKGRKSSVPLAWTDIGAQDPFVVLSAGRALFRLEDLLRLVCLIGEINNAKRKWASMMWGGMLNKLCSIC